MNEETKQELEAVIMLLRNTCIKNGVSIGFNTDSESLIFFDTEHYLKTNKFSGIYMKLEDLVN